MQATVHVLIFLFLSVLDLSVCETQIGEVLEPCDMLFDNAVEAYYKQDWLSVILNMERALRNKGAIRNVRAKCRISCANQTAFGDSDQGMGIPVPGAGPIQDLGFFQRVLKRAECVNACETEKLGPPTLHKVSDEIELEFKKRTPYNYLQVAYFKINKLDKAVAAANTFYVANPDHMEMRQNLEYYSLMAGVQDIDFKDLEARPHMAAFLEGKRLYSIDEFSSAINHFETAAEEFFSADTECRALCEGKYDYDGYNYIEYNADLFQSITDHYLHVLNCKQNCAVELASTAGREKPFEDFLPSHFNYLQFSYYNSEQYGKAIECAKTYLLFYPEDEVMKQNVAYYSAMLGEDQTADISAREVVQQYIRKSLLEKELLYFGYEIFGITFVDPDKWTPAEVMPKKLRDKQQAERETAARITEEIGNLMKEIETLVEEKSKESSEITKVIPDETNQAATSTPPENLVFDDIKLSMTSKALNGSQRVVLDGVITDDECRELHRLSNTAAQKGDGYRGRASPHSPSEMFQGVTVFKALKLGQEGLLPLKSARLFFDVSEKVRKVVESFFGLQSPLYFSYSHLVCRSAIEEKQEDRNDLSHPVHVDNCLLVSELNECIKEPPAYTHRDFSAILYLNEDFEGGDFIFTKLDAKSITAAVKPQCGRVVAFGAGKENPHGVKAVTKGQRCAVALWFTLDPRHNEKERIQADELLKMLSSPVNTDFQKSEDASTTPEQSEQETTKQGEEKTTTTTTTTEVKETPEKEQLTKTADEKTDVKADRMTDNKNEQPKTTKNATVKTASQTKAKPKPKTKEAVKIKTTTADKKKKPAVKKKAKTSNKAAVESKDKTKNKTSKVKHSQSDSQKDKDEL